MKKESNSGISFFQRYLTVWVIICMLIGIMLGHFLPGMKEALNYLEYAGISIPLAVLIWIMIYVLVGDYYVPDLKLPEEHRPIGMWGRLHRTYLEQYRPARFSALCLSGELHTYLADLNEQATERCSLIIEQMKQAEGVTETMKADNQMLWVQSMNSIRNRAEEIIRQEMIYC